MRNRKFLIITFILILLVSMTACNDTSNPAKNKEEPKQIFDMAGREVQLPSKINSIYATHTIGSIFLYTLAPEKLAGWNEKIESADQFIAEEYRNLPILGRWQGTSSANIEELLRVKPDLIINMGDINERYIEESDEITRLLGIPVVLLDGSIAKQAETYRFLGELLDCVDRATVLADYSETVYKGVTEKSKEIAPESKKRVYYGAGANGLESIPSGSINLEVLELVAGENVVKLTGNQDLRRVEVAIEELLKWNPEVIILSSKSSHNPELLQEILADKRWAQIKAIKDGYIYEIPYGPLDWLSQPPTIMRYLGLQWLGNLLYPDTYQLSIRNRTAEFFELFFGISLNEEELTSLIGN